MSGTMLNQRCFVGVDGGGSRCRVRARLADGTVYAETERGSANVHSSPDEALATVVAALRDICQQQPLAWTHIGLGLAGVFSADGAAATARQIHESLGAATVTVDTDAYTACLGAHGGQDGGIVIVGTGSAAQVLVAGQRHAFGGWGFPLGDEGSGAIIGRAAVRHALRALDGLAVSGPLAGAVLAELGSDRAGPIGWGRTARPADYARWAPAVIDAEAQGDAAASRIVGEAMDDVVAMIDRVMALGAPQFSLVGGLASLFRQRLPDRLADRHRLPQADAVDGAIFMARKAAGGPMAWDDMS